MNQELRIPAYVLRDALTGALMGVSTDRTLPIFQHIKILTNGDIVEFISTDRFILVTGAITPLDAYNTRENWADIDGLIHADTAKRIIAALKTVPKSNKNLLVTLTLSGNTVTLAGLQDNVTVSGAFVDSNIFPKHEFLFPDASLSGIDTPIGLNPNYLARLAKIPSDNETPMILTLHGKNKPVLAELPHDAIKWRVLIMPVRIAN